MKFHDAELIELNIGGARDGSIDLLHWVVTDETDDRGYFVSKDHAKVRIIIHEIEKMRLRSDGGKQTAIFNLEITPLDEGVELSWNSSVGLSGIVVARSLSFEISPANPEEV